MDEETARKLVEDATSGWREDLRGTLDNRIADAIERHTIAHCLALVDAKIAEMEQSEKENGREGFERFVRAKPLLRELRGEIEAMK